MPDVIRALFVAWQNPVTRRFSPVARLAQIEGDGCENCFEFVYIAGASEADRFQPFVSFPDLHQVYRARELFPMFANRILSRSRSDYPEYLSQLGLPASTTSPVTILSRSSGRRATDTLELFPLPEFEPDFGYRTWFWAHGMRLLTPAGRERILALNPEEQIYPQCEPDSPVDGDAIELLSFDGQRIGYMPSYLLDDAHTLQETCSVCEVYVDRLNPPPAPLQQRLLCRLESCWPDGFTPYATPRYQPLSPQAAQVRPPVFEP
jgi:hypothetical protein